MSDNDITQNPELDFSNVEVFGDTSLFNAEAVKRGEKAHVRSNFGNIVVEFCTENAIGLYRGIAPSFNAKGKQTSRGQLGLTKADDMLSNVYRAARLDDPFADQLIYNIHAASLELEQAINECEKIIDKAIDEKTKGGNIGFKITKPESCPTFNVFLKTDLGRHIFWLIVRIDKLVLKNFFCRRHQIIQREASVRINGMLSAKLWNIYHSIYIWKNTNVTRKDVLEKNQVAVRAFEEMPLLELKESILDKTGRSTFAPRIVDRPEEAEAVEATESNIVSEKSSEI
ncbi:AcaB family transcriptional regulator [Photobacterium leiognathi]|uniref:AcaB family transcriptional regulator n=1 Tax=Photobacterium leiognathi TaxID=553611 RepID=UPI002980C05E|nr:AcaB family transcriptional regulator [Photobacterium leiognathi]